RYQKLLTDASGSKLLSDEDLAKATVYDFNQNAGSIPGSQGGMNSVANTRSFPFLFGADLSVNLGTVGPCGVLLPHVHPRAHEFFVVVDNEVTFGTNLEIGLLGDRSPTPEFVGKLTKNTGTLFPQGAVHYQINDSQNCKPSTVVVFFTSDDPGTTTVLQEPVGGGNATTLGRREVGRSGFEAVRAVTPPHIVKMADACFERCN
ncbi:RmlC-like cupin domain-containing protein, partial [Massariosphaeria phaeospora]